MNDIIISYEEYTKLVSYKTAFQVGFTITISILSALLAALFVYFIFRLYFYEEKRRF